MDLIDEIEALRVEQGLTTTEMANRFGVPYQNYNNWRARGSLPKEMIDIAQSLLGRPTIKQPAGVGEPRAQYTPTEREFVYLMREISSRGEKDMARLVRMIKAYLQE